MTRKTIAIQTFAAALFLCQHLAWGAEGASSYYFPGSAGSFAVATAPPPGFTLVNQTFVYSATASRAVVNGRALANLDVFAVYDYFGPLYAAKQKVAGGTFAVGAFIPLGHLSLDATITAAIGARTANARDLSIGDMALIPGSLHWNKGNIHFKVAEQIIAPTGHYNVNNVMNVGRNYWGFDTKAALTYLNMKRGLEISAAPGIEFNTKNEATDYRTGNEFHSDFVVNQFLSKSFGLGVQAYYYNQVSPDTGTGAILGDFQGESFGWGPALFYAPKQAGGRLNITAKWLKDVHATQRLRGSYAVIVIGFKL